MSFDISGCVKIFDEVRLFSLDVKTETIYLSGDLVDDVTTQEFSDQCGGIYYKTLEDFKLDNKRSIARAIRVTRRKINEI